MKHDVLRLRSARAGAVFLLLFTLGCVVFTDISLKKRGQSYEGLWDRMVQSCIESCFCTMLEEMLPVHDFFECTEYTGNAALFCELCEAVAPVQVYLSNDWYHKKENKHPKWKKAQDGSDGTIDTVTASNSNMDIIIDYDEMIYAENNPDSNNSNDSSDDDRVPRDDVSGNDNEEECYEPGESCEWNEALEQQDASEVSVAEVFSNTAEQAALPADTFSESMEGILSENEAAEQLLANEKMLEKLRTTQNSAWLLSSFYIVDGSTKAVKSVFQPQKLINKDMTMKKTKKKNTPQILVYHTHSSEAFADSRKGKTEDTVVGVGSVLCSILSKTYGYQVCHDATEYDIVNGSLDRNKAYNQAAEGIENKLEKYPSIEVIIDLHRDSGTKRVTTIGGKKTAQIMLFNGLSRNQNGPIDYLKNDNLQGNLAFSLQLKAAAMSLYPDFAKPIYLKGYRYNLHYREKSLLIELGTDHNTVEEAKNAMEPLACIIDQVLSGKQ